AWGFGLAVCWLGTSLLVGRHFVEQARAQHAWNAYLTLLPETDQPRVVPEDSGNSPQRAELLADVCRFGSADPDHHYRLGLAYLEIFLQGQRRLGGTLSLAETRAIYEADRFKGPAEARAWLESLYGADLALLEAAQASFRRSLECCPLYGSAYVHLAELCFLD